MRNKRKKNTRQRGSKTHGWGAMKKHRGAGNRGGRGMAGTGKKGDAKKPNIWKSKYFGKYGFKKAKKIKAINLGDVEKKLAAWEKKGLAAKEKDAYIIDLGKLGYEKLLSKGSIKTKMSISVEKASKKAVEKVQKSGGQVNVLNASKDSGEE
ncbi:50S ribosomal protein L15 [Candidatus Woesearchaeota archaeon]|nr:MAG: 50S ribosomal protein L15 [Candidatus Woesearchaeota archaeon]